jgi:hypothetical protein
VQGIKTGAEQPGDSSGGTGGRGPSGEPCTTSGNRISSLGSIKAGQVNLLEGGSYSAGRLAIPQGSPGSPTVLKPYNCAKVNINVSNSVEPGSNTVVAGLTIKQSGGYGQAIHGVSGTNNVEIRNNHLSNPAGSRTNGAVTVSFKNNISNIRILNNVVKGCNEDCLQFENVGNYKIINNLFEGPVNEDLMDIKTATSNSSIENNEFHIGSPADSKGVILHGETNTSAEVTFKGNTLRGCGTIGNGDQLHINGKPGVDNTYHVINNTFSNNSGCKAIQVNACDNCILKPNNWGSGDIRIQSCSNCTRP